VAKEESKTSGRTGRRPLGGTGTALHVQFKLDANEASVLIQLAREAGARNVNAFARELARAAIAAGSGA